MALPEVMHNSECIGEVKMLGVFSVTAWTFDTFARNERGFWNKQGFVENPFRNSKKRKDCFSRTLEMFDDAYSFGELVCMLCCALQAEIVGRAWKKI